MKVKHQVYCNLSDEFEMQNGVNRTKIPEIFFAVERQKLQKTYQHKYSGHLEQCFFFYFIKPILQQKNFIIFSHNLAPIQGKTVINN